MSDKSMNREERTCSIKNEQTRQRWELFHRAIAHAKQTNIAELEDRPEPGASPLLLVDSLRP